MNPRWLSIEWGKRGEPKLSPRQSRPQPEPRLLRAWVKARAARISACKRRRSPRRAGVARARCAWAYATIVIAGLAPAIHLLGWTLLFLMDARVKPAHDQSTSSDLTL